MKDSEKRFINYWKTTREKSKWKFVFIHGVIAWGTITAIILFLLNWGLDHSFKTNLDSEIWARILKISLSPYLGGLLYGFTIWYLSEKRYKKLVNK